MQDDSLDILTFKSPSIVCILSSLSIEIEWMNIHVSQSDIDGRGGKTNDFFFRLVKVNKEKMRRTVISVYRCSATLVDSSTKQRFRKEFSSDIQSKKDLRRQKKGLSALLIRVLFHIFIDTSFEILDRLSIEFHSEMIFRRHRIRRRTFLHFG